MVRLFFFRLMLCLLGGGFGPVSAQTVDTTRVHELQQVEVSAVRRPSVVRSASPLQVVSGAEMERLGYQSLADAVRRFSGVTVKDYGGIGGLKTVSVRSLGAYHTGVMYDGIAVSNCQAGQIDIGRFSLDNVSQVTLAVGQEDDIFQPARMFASAGVLSIQTQRPEFRGNRDYSLQLRMKGGSFGLVNPSLRYAWRLASRTSLSVDGDFLRADGTYPFTLKNGQSVTREKRYNSDILSWHTEANLYSLLRDSSRVTAKVYYFQSERGLPGGVIFYNPYNKERLWDRNFFVQAGYEKHFNPRWALKGAMKYNYSWNRYMDVNNKYASGKQIDRNRQQEYYATVSGLYTPKGRVSYVLATDFAYNRLTNNFTDTPRPERYTSQTVLTARYRHKGVTVNGMLLATYIKEKVASGDCPDDKRRLSPGVSLSLQPWLDRNLYVRLFYKHVFRVPTFNDLYYLRMGNRNLKPETAVQYNAGITWSGQWKGLEYASVTADVYYNRVEDKIVALPMMYVWKMMNMGTVDIWGSDVKGTAEFGIARRIHCRINGSYTWQRAIDLTDKNEKNYKDQIPYTPQHSGSLSASLLMPWVNVSYTALVCGERYALPQNVAANRIDRYAEHTLSVNREFQWHGTRFRLQADVVNFTDEQYSVIQYYPMPGRSYRLSASVVF